MCNLLNTGDTFY